VRQYSDDKPRELVRDVTWAAAGYTGPVDGLMTAASRILAAEYPIGQVPRALIMLALAVVPPATLVLQADTTLPAAAVVRVTFTAGHVVDGSDDTVPLAHRDAVAAYAAHMLCRELAAYFSGERESSIGADGSNTESRARNYALRAKDYRTQYFAVLGLVDPAGAGGGAGSSAAAAMQSAGATVSWPGRDRRSFRALNAGWGS
jgi:hypothetical protein